MLWKHLHHKDGQRNEGANTLYKISGIMSRAPTEALCIFQKADSDSSRDPFKFLPTVVHEKLTCDGREVINTQELGSDVAREYQDLRQGAIRGRGDPTIPKIVFGAHSGDDHAHGAGLLSNTACNSVELSLQSAEACDLCITAEQCQTFRFEAGTLKYSNAY